MLAPQQLTLRDRNEIAALPWGERGNLLAVAQLPQPFTSSRLVVSPGEVKSPRTPCSHGVGRRDVVRREKPVLVPWGSKPPRPIE